MASFVKPPKRLTNVPIDQVYVIYGGPGSGKTVLASTFPATPEKPMLYVDIVENDTGSINEDRRKNIVVQETTEFEELEPLLDDLIQGFSITEEGKKYKREYSTIVFNTATQLEFLMNQYLMTKNDKDTMSLNLWGQTRERHDYIWNMAKVLHKKTGAIVVIIAHEKLVDNENHPEFNQIVPSITTKAAVGLCAKASFVWYTKIEPQKSVDQKTKKVVTEYVYNTYIDRHPFILSKTRKPENFMIPTKIKNLTYDKFKKNVIDKL